MGCVRRRHPSCGARNTAFSRKATVSLGCPLASLASESPPDDRPVERRSQPAIAPRVEGRILPDALTHHAGMAASKPLENLVILELERVLRIQFRFRGWRGVPVIDLGLLLLFGQHGLRVLDPPIMEDPPIGR